MTIKHLFLFICFCSISNSFFAQNLAKINNSITPQHEKVEGTKIYMIPPTGFSQAKPPLIGFVEDAGESSILVNESAGSYKSTVQTFMSENMTILGMKLITQEKITLNGSEATFLKLTQKVNKSSFMKFLMFFGDEEYCILMSAVFPLDDNKLENDIKKAMLTVAYKEEIASIPMPKGFRLDFQKSGLKYARSISDAVIYSEDGKTSPSSLAKNSFFAGNGKASTTDFATFSADRLQKQIKTTLKIESNKPITLGGLQGQEIVATTTTSDGKARTLYQVLLFRGDTYYILYGSTMDKMEAQMATFKALAKSFELEK